MTDPEDKNLSSSEDNIPLEGVAGNHLRNLLDLSSDMKQLLQSRQMTDIILSIRDSPDALQCHSDILKFRSKWFYNAVCKANSRGTHLIQVEEEPRVMEAVLGYVYTGDLRLLESSNIHLVEVFEAAEKYGFTRLREITKRMLESSGYREITKYTQFKWIVQFENGSVSDAVCPSLDNFTVCGEDRWQMTLKNVSSPDEGECNVGIYLQRKTEEPCTTIHNVHILIRISDSSGKCLRAVFDKPEFRMDGERSIIKPIPLTTLLEGSTDLFSSGTLTLICEMTFWARVGFLTKFTLTGPRRRYISNELVHLSEDMFNVLRDGRTHDVVFSSCHVKMHNFMLQVRSRIPKEFVEKLEARAGIGNKRLWMSFASFLYTGQSRFLDEHARALYAALSELKLTMAREKFSYFLARNLNLENAFCVMNEAVTHEDDTLSLAAANFLADKSQIESDPQAWIRIAKDKESMLKFLPQFYTFKQFW